MIDDRFFLDPTCKLYLPLERLDGAAFASRDQYGLACSVAGAKWEIEGRYFDGNQDKIDVVGDKLDFTTGDFTIVGCYKIDNDLAAHRTLFSRGDYEVDGYYLLLQNTGVLYFFTNQAGAKQNSSIAAADIVYDAWADYAIVRKGSTCRMYINGIDKTAVPAVHENPLTNNRVFKVGLYADDASFGLLGWCKYIAAYGEAKSATWLRSLYEARQ